MSYFWHYKVFYLKVRQLAHIAIFLSLELNIFFKRVNVKVNPKIAANCREVCKGEGEKNG